MPHRHRRANRLHHPAGRNQSGGPLLHLGRLGRLASRTAGRSVVETYDYDVLDRVREVDYPDTTTSVQYFYDAVGRVEQRNDGSGVTFYAYDRLGRLTARGNATTGVLVSYNYDKVGNIATDRARRADVETRRGCD
jgi:YD repeat-containing protein